MARAKVAAKKPARRAVRGPSAALRAHAAAVAEALERALPEPRCELDHRNAFELLIATILSAQTTDKSVNKVTPELFARFPDAAALAKAPEATLERILRPIGFFRTKAASIKTTAKLLVDRHAGAVPRTMAELVKLRGVARKTASVVLGTAFGVAEGIAVDTHVARVSGRLGLTKARTPLAIERALMALFPREAWPALQHRLVLHGRYTCTARAPRCDACPLAQRCPARVEP